MTHRVIFYAQLYNLDFEQESGDLIADAAKSFKLNPDAGWLFIKILSQPGSARILRLMADLGLLQKIIPQFDELLCLVPGDAAHKYTVGEHSLRTVDQLQEILSEDNELLVDVFSRIQHFEVLFIAALMHDIGKLDSNNDHTKTGAFRAVKFAQMLSLPKEACEKIEFLVRNHLKMSETARFRDLQQRKTIQDFISVVDNLQILDMLLLLTIADYRAVGGKHWSQVQTRFLLELHERAASALRHPQNGDADLERHRKRVRRELCLANLPAEDVEEHCTSMPARYLLNTSPEELASHIGFIKGVREGTPAVDIRDDRSGQFTQITVVAKDMTGLLSMIAGVLYAVDVDVHAAQIFTRDSYEDNIAIDTLYVDFEGRQLAEMKKWQVEGELMSVLNGELTVSELLKRRKKNDFKVPTNLTIKSLQNVSDHESVIEIRAEDTPGLLYYLTRKISEQGLNIHNARVTTWGHEARDVFYVTKKHGDKLTDEDVEKLGTALLQY